MLLLLLLLLLRRRMLLIRRPNCTRPDSITDMICISIYHWLKKSSVLAYITITKLNTQLNSKNSLFDIARVHKWHIKLELTGIDMIFQYDFSIPDSNKVVNPYKCFQSHSQGHVKNSLLLWQV